MEWGEQPHETALRELAEETGLRASLGPVLGVFSRWLNPDEAPTGEPGQRVGVIFVASDIEGELRTEFNSDDTTDGAAWFTLDDITTLKRTRLVDYALTLLAERSVPVGPCRELIKRINETGAMNADVRLRPIEESDLALLARLEWTRKQPVSSSGSDSG